MLTVVLERSTVVSWLASGQQLLECLFLAGKIELLPSSLPERTIVDALSDLMVYEFV
jgi:hypothetical protein